MDKKFLYGLGILVIGCSMSGTALADPVMYDLPWFDNENPLFGINVPNEEYNFEFDCIVPPTETLGTFPHGVEELQGGVLTLEHRDGDFSLDTQAVGVFIDEVYFGPLFVESNSDNDQEEIYLDWHQLNSITGDGTAIVRVVNNNGVGAYAPGNSNMVEYGEMRAWLVYDGVPGACDDSDGDGVPDSVDSCASTSAGDVVDDTGCSIADLCPCDNEPPWKNHGQYVSCTAGTAESFMEQGLITEEDKDAIVFSAAQSSCGDKE